jgi:hypothetical protein
VPVKDGLHALRAALIGTPDGPPVALLLKALGPSEAEARVRRAALTRPGSSGDSGVPQDSAGQMEA